MKGSARAWLLTTHVCATEIAAIFLRALDVDTLGTPAASPKEGGPARGVPGTAVASRMRLGTVWLVLGILVTGWPVRRMLTKPELTAADVAPILLAAWLV